VRDTIFGLKILGKEKEYIFLIPVKEEGGN
jgi:hypothetical protein